MTHQSPPPDNFSPQLEAALARLGRMVRAAGARHGVGDDEAGALMQEVRIRLWRAHTDSEEIARLPTSYVYRTATTAALDLVRKRRRHEDRGPSLDSAQLKLTVNTVKSVVVPAWTRSFLGYSFWVAPGKIVKRRVAPKALVQLKERLREITSRNGGRGPRKVTAELRSYLVGWKAYVRLADTPKVLSDVDQWLHRRLRMLMLKQWKRVRTMYRESQRGGVGGAALGIAARFGRSWWHVAAHQALHIALPGAHFVSLGVPRLGPS